MLQSGLIVVLVVHLLAVNFASAGPFVALWLFWKAWQRSQTELAIAGRRMLGWSLGAVGIGVLTGAAVLGMLWCSATGFFEAAGRLPASRYWFGGLELLFYAACLAMALAFSRVEDLAHPRRFWGVAALLVLGGLDLVYHFPPLFVGINTLASRPDDWTEKVHFVQLLLDPQVTTMVAHFALAAAASGGVGLMLLALPMEAVAGQPMIRAGAWLTLAATLAQLPLGVLVLVHLPPEARDALLGADAVAGVLFALSIVATVGLLQRTVAIGLGETEPRAVRTAAMLLALVVLLMVVAQQRAARLREPRAVSGPKTVML